MTDAFKCDTCKTAIPDDDVDECTVYVGGPDDRDSYHLCSACFSAYEAEREVEARHWLAEYQAGQLADRDPEEYRRQMIEAGRGHLVKP